MSIDGFDFKELTDYSKKMLSTANSIKNGKETKKMLKKEGGKLTKENKNAYKSKGIGTGQGKSKDFEKSFKTGKVYKFQGDWTVRAYNGDLVFSKDGKKYSLGGILNNGFIHKNRDGSETFVPGYHFMEEAQEKFGDTFEEDLDKWLNELLDKGLL